MAATPRLRLRVVFEPGKAMGPGKADLLAAVDETGSIAAAARAMEMSYKRAWYLIDSMNQIYKGPVVEAVKGGREHGGAVLTPLGRDVLEGWRALEAHAARAVATDLRSFRRLVAG